MPEFALRFALIFYGRILFKIITCYTRLALFSLKPFCIHSFSTSVSMIDVGFLRGGRHSEGRTNRKQRRSYRSINSVWVNGPGARFLHIVENNRFVLGFKSYFNEFRFKSCALSPQSIKYENDRKCTQFILHSKRTTETAATTTGVFSLARIYGLCRGSFEFFSKNTSAPMAYGSAFLACKPYKINTGVKKKSCCC